MGMLEFRQEHFKKNTFVIVEKKGDVYTLFDDWMPENKWHKEVVRNKAVEHLGLRPNQMVEYHGYAAEGLFQWSSSWHIEKHMSEKAMLQFRHKHFKKNTFVIVKTKG